MRNIENEIAKEHAPAERSDVEETVLRSLFASIPLLAFFQDLDGRFRFVTSAAARSFGRTRKGLEGRTLRELGIEDEMTGTLDKLREATLTKGGRSSSEIRSTLDARCYEYSVIPVWGTDGAVRGTFTTAVDITERKENEDLRESQEILQAVVEGTCDPIFVKDREGHHIMVNSAALRTFGRSMDEFLGKTDMEVNEDPELAKNMMDADRLIMRSGACQVMEDPVLTPRGRRVFLTTRAPYRDRQGQIIGMIAIARDITNRKQMEEGLREGERWFSSLIENAPVAIAMSRNGMTTFGNSRYLELFGYHSIDELLGRPFIEQIAPHDRQKALEFTLDFEEGRSGETDMELLGVRKDGSVFPFQAAITSVDLGDGPATLGFFTDVTESRKAEEEMLQARRKFESLFSAANEGIALHANVYDAEGRVIDYRILDVNPAYERITGIPRSRAVGTLASELYGTNEPPYLETFTKVGEIGEPTTLETYFPPLDKHLFVSIFSPAVGQFATIFIDITERKRLERDLQEAKSRAELYVDLLTHDISNYNTAAMGYLQLAEMRLRVDEKDRKLIAGPLQVLRDSSELIANIQDLKRVEAGREKTRPVDVCDILSEVKYAYERTPDREVAIDLEGSDRCWVMASGLLRDVFSNIVSNAIKHSSGPITVGISVDRLHHDGKDLLRVSVEDNGPGIPDHRKETIFDRSLMGLTKPVSRGLGLYLVRRLVEEFGGRVWVEDRVPGDHTKGARFVVMLPRAVDH